MKKFYLLLFAILMAGSLMNAADMAGTYKIGSASGANYATLSAAVDALNAATITGDIVFEITSDIAEPTNFGLAKDMGSFKLTIRPDADADRTITFSQATANVGPYGHFVIGCATANIGATLTDATVIPTNNITIDGYAVGGSTKRLNFYAPNAALAGSTLINIVASSNITIKNCILNDQSSTAAKCIYINQFKGTTADISPSNILITNNIITANNPAISGYGIQCSRSGSATTKITGLQITDNVVTASAYGIEVNYCNGATVSGNEIKLQKGTATGAGYALWIRGTQGDMNVFGNKFTEVSSLQTNAATIQNFAIFTGATATNPYNLNIFNNTFSGMKRTASGPTALNQAYIAEIGYGTTKIYHNSFYLPALALPTQAGYYNAIAFTTVNYKADVQNNIFISDEDAKSVLVAKAITAGVVDNNIYYLRAGNTNARVVDTYATLSAFQTANTTLDVHSKYVNVNFVDAANGNLNLAAASEKDANLAVPRLASVLTDMTGKTRAELTYAGAYEGPLPFNPASLDQNTLEGMRIRNTANGLELKVNKPAQVELYSINGVLVDKVLVNQTYSRSLDKGVYLVRANGKTIKFVK